MSLVPDPDRYFDNVLNFVRPGGPTRPSSGPAEDWQTWWRSRAEAADEPLRTASRHGFVLTRAELAALGVTRSRARHQVRHDRWTCAGYGLVAPLDVRAGSDGYEVSRRRHAVGSAGAARRRPGAGVSGRSGAILHGLPTLRVPDSPELTESDVGLGRRGPAHLFGATLDAAETAHWFGVNVETVGRTLVTLARHGRKDALMAADAALREGLVDARGIAVALGTAFGWPWVRRAREVLALADPRAESPLESITRLALHDDGFPPPVLQAWLGIDRVDFYWPEHSLVLEADGRVKYTDDASWREKQREQRLREHVDRIERVVWADVMQSWPRTRTRLWRAFH